MTRPSETSCETSCEPLTDAEAALLVAFETAPSLEKLATLSGRDPTVLSRQLSRIAERGDYLLKVSGRWKISELGRRYNELTRDHEFARDALLRRKLRRRVGASREFLTRVVAPDFSGFSAALPNSTLTLVACEGGTEAALLAGEIDFGLDCGRPESPEIHYAPESTEKILAVASPAFWRRHFESGLARAPHVHCDRLQADVVTAGEMRASEVAVRTNDLATARELCLSGIGWALLPEYSVRAELRKRALVVVGPRAFTDRYGVWRLRARTGLRDDFERLRAWLRTVPLA